MARCYVCWEINCPRSCENCGKTVCVYHYARIQKTLETEHGNKYIKVKEVCPACFLNYRDWEVLAYGMFGGIDGKNNR